jgi:hypothetical protein
VIYGLVLSLISWVRRRREAPLIFPRHTFAVLIPTENDEDVIGATLEHLRQMKYPRNMFDLLVLPVNSSDQTAVAARQAGASVIGPGKRRWETREEAVLSSIERLASKQRHDAFVVLDAAARVSASYLTVLSDKLSKGAWIIQSGYRLASKGPSFSKRLSGAFIALAPSWLTVWSSTYRVGSAIRPVGYCLSRRLVEKFGVRDPGPVESEAYRIHLLKNDVVVTFTDQAMVYDASFHPYPHSGFKERIRSHWRHRIHKAIPLIREGIEWRSVAQTLGGISLLLPSFSTMMAGAGVLLLGSVYRHGWNDGLTIGWIGVIAGLLSVAFVRMTHIDAPVTAYVGLPVAPIVRAWTLLQPAFRRSQDAGSADSETSTQEKSVQQKKSYRRRFRGNQKRQPAIDPGG